MIELGMTKAFAAIVAFILLMAGPALAETRKLDLQADVDQAREAAGVVALGAVIATSDDGVIALAVSGQRAAGRDDPVQPGDSWHIGSNTKMLTALLYARLVEAGHARWGATLPELFPDLAKEMDPGWKSVTIEDLLSHRSGAAPNASRGWMIAAIFSEKPVAEQRASLAKTVLTSKPGGKRGSFTYSNLGYILAGAAIEDLAQRTPELGGKAYETLLREFVVAKGPTGATAGFGFGPPQKGLEGHAKGLFARTFKPQGRDVSADNPAALAPAGTAHYSLRGHALMLLSFMEGPRALPAPIRKKLLTPYPDAKSIYALGWGAAQAKAPRGNFYGHSGSNTMWLSQVTLLTDLGVVIIVNTNQMDAKADKAVSGLTEKLIKQLSGEAK